MNKEDIISMAKQAGYYTDDEDVYDGSNFFIHTKEITKFAELVSAHERYKYEIQFKKMQNLYEIRESQPNKPCCLAEREACAKVCEDLNEAYHIGDYNPPNGEKSYHDCAAAIRARGEK